MNKKAKRMPTEPIGHPWGRESTASELSYRIKWETWVAGEQRRLGMLATALAHDLSRMAYEERLNELLARVGGT